MTISMQAPASKEAPWYKQFWPWFIITLPACVVVGGITMLVVAIKYGDQPVVGDYYKEGLAINERLAADHLAKRLNISGELEYLGEGATLTLRLQGASELPEKLRLEFHHPVDSALDFNLELPAVAAAEAMEGTDLQVRRYLGNNQRALQQRWYWQLSPVLAPAVTDENSLWRLRGEMDLRHDRRIELLP